MKAATINELKKELTAIAPQQVMDICLRLARFKKENKELLTYLLFEEGNEEAYILSVQNEIAAQFEEVNKANLYFAKKTIRKILRLTNKYSRYSGNKETEVRLLIHFCLQLKNSGIAFKKSTALDNLYQSQLNKIEKAIAAMEEDLQYDYRKGLQQLH